jgi:hypothetical protein
MSGGILPPRAVTAGGERFAVRANRSEIAMRDFMLGVLLAFFSSSTELRKSFWLTAISHSLAEEE